MHPTHLDFGRRGRRRCFDISAFWSLIEGLNDNFGSLGLLIIGLFAASWAIAVAIYRLKRFGEVEATRG